MFSIVSLNLGTPREIHYAPNRKLITSMCRKPVTQKVFLDLLGFEGDQIADPVDHGGRDKAVCGYPAEHYSFWEEELSRTVTPPSFGENLTIQGLTEDQIHIGDVFQMGEAEVQCSQPREPCHKLTKILEHPQLAARFQETGYCGYYFRVMKQGWVQAGMPVERIHSDEQDITVLDAHRLMYQAKRNYEMIERLMAHHAISESWKNGLGKRLAKRQT